jgi:hypothetical protein
VGDDVARLERLTGGMANDVWSAPSIGTAVSAALAYPPPAGTMRPTILDQVRNQRSSIGFCRSFA